MSQTELIVLNAKYGVGIDELVTKAQAYNIEELKQFICTLGFVTLVCIIASALMLKNDCGCKEIAVFLIAMAIIFVVFILGMGCEMRKWMISPEIMLHKEYLILLRG